MTRDLRGQEERVLHVGLPAASRARSRARTRTRSSRSPTSGSTSSSPTQARRADQDPAARPGAPREVTGLADAAALIRRLLAPQQPPRDEHQHEGDGEQQRRDGRGLGEPELRRQLEDEDRRGQRLAGAVARDQDRRCRSRRGTGRTSAACRRRPPSGSPGTPPGGRSSAAGSRRGSRRPLPRRDRAPAAPAGRCGRRTGSVTVHSARKIAIGVNRTWIPRSLGEPAEHASWVRTARGS